MTVLFVFLLFINGGGADFLGTFDNYNDQIHIKLGLATSETSLLSDTNCNQFVREAVIATMPYIRGDKVVLNVTTTYRQNTYSLDSTLLGISAVFWSKNDSLKVLKYTPIENWGEVIKTETSGKQNGYDKRPSSYDYIDDKLFVYPTPTYPYGDTLHVVAWRKVPDIAAYDSLSVIPQQFRNPILLYATYLAAYSMGHPMTELFKAEYEKAISLVNAAINSRGYIEKANP